ncbi:unnamed protein product [Gemmataceae bacterium]|nr:unnamed protein product [Gemmataceae bacterium]VTT96557.1 unnamed protein product [Gemmataceae bacterium]
MSISPNFGRPGVSAARTAQILTVCRSVARSVFYPHGGIIDGASRDYGNSDNLYLLRPGLPMGRVTSSKKWKPSVVAVTQGAYTSGGTSLTLTAAGATELVRRVGASGTFTLKSAATAGGTLTSDTVTYSAVNTGTGVVTITNIGANRITGSIVTAADGSEVPLTVIPDGYGIEVPTSGADVDFPHILTGADLDVARIIDYPADATLKTWLKTAMRSAGGVWTFSDDWAAA